jgi:hypothetical protein
MIEPEGDREMETRKREITISPIPRTILEFCRDNGVDSGELHYCGNRYHVDPAKGVLTFRLWPESIRSTLQQIQDLIPADDIDQFEIREKVPEIEAFRKKVAK